MGTTLRCRRRHARHRFSENAEASVEFGYPNPQSRRCSMRIRDISPSGLSFVLSHELPGLEVGTCIRGASVRVEGHAFHGDLLVMHVTPSNDPGSICGVLFYPASDEDLDRLNAALPA